MAVFRAIFCGVFCAMVLCVPGWGAENCHQDKSGLINGIKQYTKGDISKFLKYDCISNGTASWHPLHWALSPRGCPANVAAVNAMLDSNHELVDLRTEYGIPTIQSVVSACCGGGGCGKGKEFDGGCSSCTKTTYEAVKSLVDHGADLDIIVDAEVQVRSSQKKVHGTLLDYVRLLKDGDICRYTGSTHCEKIEQLLIEKGVKPYVDGQTNNNSAPVTTATTQSKTCWHKFNLSEDEKKQCDLDGAYNKGVFDCKPTKKDHVFQGWCTYDKDSREEKCSFQVDLKHVCDDGKDKEFYAKWEPENPVIEEKVVSEETVNTRLAEPVTTIENPNEKTSLNADADDDKKVDVAAGGSVVPVRDGVIQQNIDVMKVTECKPCAGNYSVICRDKKVGDECVYETKCRNSDWKLFNDGQYDAYCEEPPQLDASMVRPSNVSCSEEELNSINAVIGTKNSDGQCEPLVCKIDYEIKDKTCVKQECTKSQLKDLNAASGGIENEVCIPKDCLGGFKLVDGKCVDAAELEKQMQDAESAYDDALSRETSTANRALSGLTMAATGIGGMELARGLAEKDADKDAASDMAA